MSTSQAPKWFKIVVVLALLWNLMGILNFIMQINLSDEAIAALPSAEQALINNTPFWSTIAFGDRRIWRYFGLPGAFNAQKMVLFPFAFFIDCSNGTNDLLDLLHRSCSGLR